MHDHAPNPKAPSRALAATSLTLLTLVTLVACLSATQANAHQRDTRAARITATIFGPHACLAALANTPDNKPLPAPNMCDAPTTTIASQPVLPDAPLYAPLRAIPPPIC